MIALPSCCVPGTMIPLPALVISLLRCDAMSSMSGFSILIPSAARPRLLLLARQPSIMSGTHLFQHPRLGGIIGRVLSRDLVQYCSIPYASISQRFARSTVLETLPNKPYDASKPGPCSIQPLKAVEMDEKSNQLPIEGEEEEQAEDCLNLNVFAPTSVSSSEKLPVLCFIHGGQSFPPRKSSRLTA